MATSDGIRLYALEWRPDPRDGRRCDRDEALVASTGARVIVQHELADPPDLPRFPGDLR